MNKLDKIIDFVERHKYGILGTLILHVGAFVFFQMATYKEAVIFEPWHFQNINQPAPDNISITPDQIETKQEAALLQTQKVTSFVKNENDTRKRSFAEGKQFTSYDEKGDPRDIERQYEQEMRDKILGKDFDQKQIKAREKESNADLQMKDDPNNTKPNESTAPSKEAVGGATMVSYSLIGRFPLNHNDWYVRNPGYTCGNVNGVVVVAISVDKGGHVTKAEVLQNRSINATYCMQKQAKKYALLSRFNYKENAQIEETGTITYRFVYND